MPVVYSAATLAMAAQELLFLPAPSVVADTMLPDYSRLRDQARACLRGGAP